ncbi:hypothetical protein FZ751_08450 [Campylobacter jejuni]|uniref:Uncharacterized protein n=2 Tax=Campylobacter TaxID=194 RepID=A0A5T0Z9P1_CAMJU|nr:hypothetical protein AEI23_07330 [Campylobacter jejuni]EAB5337439.1 hypothetical protein [Campylobacter coli]EIA40648.1 hypothetical protein cco10_09405 [Campylobacter coli 90-3]EIA89795.1 hypothetical protein cco75_08918 [Campylobacter coli LMG 9854]EIB60297.1 hypothetical protein cje21_03608 [Campylobacter jejuni subsp. jejuni 1997-7]KQI04990.1 hypothetical protein K774_04875 [Campylobacter jejuni CVM 41973]KQI40301.1 hypothetical protein Y867_07210 [Campylobacter jejuni CVM 41914]KQI44
MPKNIHYFFTPFYDIINLIHLVDGLKVSQPVYNVFGSILSIGIELFFWLLSWAWGGNTLFYRSP